MTDTTVVAPTFMQKVATKTADWFLEHYSKFLTVFGGVMLLNAQAWMNLLPLPAPPAPAPKVHVVEKVVVDPVRIGELEKMVRELQALQAAKAPKVAPRKAAATPAKQ